ncbi:protein HGH1 family protein [Kocuria palustris]|nr:protein HGH1 family protein [Kocuria palustris]
MSSSPELIELVEFLHSTHPAVIQLAINNLVGFSQGPHKSVFSNNQYEPIKDLKRLSQEVFDKQVVTDALTILANLCEDVTIRDLIVEDEDYLNWLALQICNVKNTHADLMCILLTNLAKNDAINKILDMTMPTSETFPSGTIIDSLMDCFVKGHDRSLNPAAEFDYLAYFFADISRFNQGRLFFITEQQYDGVVPLQKLLVFTEFHKSKIRREGVASTIKNSLFDTNAHMKLLSDEKINLLPYILLPLAGPEEIDEDEMFNLPEELQLLDADKKREPEASIICTHLESLLLLCTTRQGREYLRSKSVYSIIRELHKAVENEDVADLCDRLVQMLQRDEAPEEENIEIESDDDDDKIVEVA